MNELPTDEAIIAWNDGSLSELNSGNWGSGNAFLAAMYNRITFQVTQANEFLRQTTDAVLASRGVSGPLHAEIQTYRAEARFLRALSYWHAVDLFGNYILVTENDAVGGPPPQRATRQQIYDFIVTELTAIQSDLPAPGASSYGRANTMANQMLLAKVYLNAGVYTGTPHWDKVIALTDEIIASGKYQLDATYRGPFARTNDKSKEIIFAVPYDAINATQSNFHMKTLKPDLRFVFGLQAQPWGGSASNPQFIDTYDPADGRLADTWLMGTQRDAQGRGYDFVKFVPSITKTEFYHGYPVKKYEIYSGETGASDVDYPALRYAEVLMMKAEALLRTGQADAAAALVTQVRQRDFTGANAAKATVTGADLSQGSVYNYGWYDTDGVVKTGPGGTPTTNGGADVQYGRFLDELGWEFAIEAHRRTDLIRFGVFTTKTWFNHKPNGTFRTIFAIPSNAIQTNSKLKQNTGY
jgi:hypothetical protein